MLRIDQDRQPPAPVADEQVIDKVAAALRAQMIRALARLNNQAALYAPSWNHTSDDPEWPGWGPRP